MKEFLMKLLSIESITGNTHEVKQCMQLFADHAEERGLDILWNENPLYLIVGRGDLSHPEVGIVCHLDVVPPFVPPRIDGDRVYGRGSIDMKGPTVATYMGLLESDHPSCAIAFTGDEETGGETAAHLATRFVPERVLVVPDQNRDFEITKEAKGVISFTVRARGKSAHGSKPWLGQNAVERVLAVRSELKDVLEIRNEPGWHNTLNLAFIRSPNEAYNVVPEQAEAGFDLRYASEDADHWVRRAQDAIEGLGLSADFSATASRIAVQETSELLLWADCVERVASARPALRKNPSSCDARFWQGRVPTLIITKSAGGKSHAPDEYASYESLEKLAGVTRLFLGRLRSQRHQG